MALSISANFDAGAVEVIDAADPQHIRLNIRRDSHADYRQWFYFRASGVAHVPCRYAFENAGACSYADGWHGYQVVASYDRREWFRIADTDYADGVLRFSHTPALDSVWYAYFEPYSFERHQDLVAQAAAHPLVRAGVLGASVEGRELDVLHVGTAAPGKRQVWIVARQHPGESMAEWFCDGLIARLLDAADPVARALLGCAEVHVVPNINPDGAIRGNLRSNAAGANLNREWAQPTAERSPEVLHTLRAMRETGCDVFLDIHGDETLPYVFIDGCSMLPGFTAEQGAREARFLARLKAASPDFQTEVGYAPDRFSDEMLTLASKQIGHAFGCLSLTLEMPFKDNANLPDARTGWNGARSQRLGAAVLEALLDAVQG